MLLTALLAVPLLFRAFRNEKTDWKLIGITNAFVVLLLAVAAASPAVQTETEQVSQREIIHLNDKSASMMTDGPNISIEGVSINSKTLASGNTSNLQKALLNRVESNKTYLVRTDLQGLDNTEKIVEEYNRRNSSINVFKTDLEREASVSISGPDVAVPGAQNSYTARISSTDGEERRVRILVDGEEKITETKSGEIRFKESFDQEGYHRIEARILNASDGYSVNNRYYKSVKVIEKPELLVIGDEGQLNNRLSEFYDITQRERVPDDLSQYYSVVLKKNLANPGEIRPYLIDGNGLMYTGDGTMDILPVERSQERDETVNPSMVMALDVSETEFCSGENCNRIDVETSRSFGLSVVKSLNQDYPGTELGMLAYSDGYFPLVEPGVLRENSDRMGNSLRRLRLRGGDEYHQLGIHESAKMLNGSGNILLVTDGVIPAAGVYSNAFRLDKTGQPKNIDSDLYPSDFDISKRSINMYPEKYRNYILDYIENRMPEEVDIYTVAVGNESQKNLPFLRDLAAEGGGTAFDSVDEFYENPPEDIGGGGYGENKYLKKVNYNHYITSSFGELNVATSNFDQVKTRDSARKLVATSGGRPALSSWRYGLGRVASFSAGGKDLEQVLSQEPGLVSRTVSWTVGDPQRKENSTVNVDSARRGGQVVISSEQEMEGLTRKSEGRYEARIRPNETGFHSFQEHEFTYNYRKELQGLGYRDSELEQLASRTGGEVLTPEELDSLRSEATVTESEVTETRSLSVFFLLAALLVFLGQVGYRKFNGLL